MLLTIVLLIIGLLLLVFGGDTMIRGATATAVRLGVPTLLIAFTFVAIGTSAPELVVSLKAIADGNNGISVGNVIGSNIANILCLFGVCGLIAAIPVKKSPALVRDTWMMFIVSLLTVLLSFYGVIERWTGALMVLMLAAYIAYAYLYARRHPEDPAAAEEVEVEQMALSKSLLLLVGGIIGIVFGADLFVRSAAEIATALGVSDAIIGLTLVAFGTSLPEIVTAVIAIRKNESDVLYGTILGSNLFNILLILGISSLVHPLEIGQAQYGFDLMVMLASAGVVMYYVLSGKTIKRFVALIMLAIYLAWVAQQFI